MDHPRRRAGRTDRPTATASTGDDGPGPRSSRMDWPAHPWVGLVERFVEARDPAPASGCWIIVIWWETRAGRQPVVLARPVRHH
jgi:hypothetical protein